MSTSIQLVFRKAIVQEVTLALLAGTEFRARKKTVQQD
jgi:hypothetical protein